MSQPVFDVTEAVAFCRDYEGLPATAGCGRGGGPALAGPRAGTALCCGGERLVECGWTPIRIVLDAKYLRRENGFYWLDIRHEWRIGATATRILSLAEQNGSRFRNFHPRALGSRGHSFCP
ncbi:MAG: hypothetical protein IJJ26_07265 [Victivallales bacterium]|nr:hypothetical protein [Victivallales bacterium]